MYSKYGLGLNALDFGSVGVKEAIINAKKTSEIVKSQMQLTKMTNLLKSINSENEILTQKLVKLSDENKQLKKVISSAQKNKIINKSTQVKQNELKQYGSSYKKQIQQPKPVQMNYSIMNQTDRFRKDSDIATFKPSSFLREYKSTQTSPSRIPQKPITHQIAINASRTPEKYQHKYSYQNPEASQSMKKQRALSLHRLTPSNSIQIKDIPITSFKSVNSQQTPIKAINFRDAEGQQSGKKRYLSLVSLRK